jgi:hypothetical protein
MLFRIISAFITLTTAAGFLGWVKSHSPVVQEEKRTERAFAGRHNPASSAKRGRSNRLQVAEAAR